MGRAAGEYACVFACEHFVRGAAARPAPLIAFVLLTSTIFLVVRGLDEKSRALYHLGLGLLLCATTRFRESTQRADASDSARKRRSNERNDSRTK